MSNDIVLMEKHSNGVLLVTLNRADKHNAINKEMFDHIASTILKIKRDPDVRAVVIQGAGIDFCTGLDIKAMLKSPSTAAKLLWKLNPWSANSAQIVSLGWRQLSVPVIMAIHGRCWGGGLQVALGGDFRIASKDASFSIMEARYGLIPDMGGNAALKQLMPVDQAMKLAMTADVIDAETALRVNLVTELSDDPLASALDLADKLAKQSPDSNGAIKKLYITNWHKSAGAMLMKETWYQIKVLLGKNQRIAVKRESGEDIPYLPAKRW